MCGTAHRMGLSQMSVCALLSIVFSQLTLFVAGCMDSHVCNSMLKITPSQVINDAIYEENAKIDQYCSCHQCPFNWASGNNVLTWYHHARSDYQVQYQFCEDVIPERTCTWDENKVAVIRVNQSHWQPYITRIACRCPTNLFYLKGWTFKSIEESEKKKSTLEWWEYNYECYQPTCSSVDACARHYMDRAQTRTTGYRFKCMCPEGFECPLVKEGTRIQSLPITDQDQEGPYLERHCEPIKGWMPYQPLNHS